MLRSSPDCIFVAAIIDSNVVRSISKRKKMRLVKKARRSINQAIRSCSANWRLMPDSIIVGAQKAGTSSLFSYLAQHEQVLTSSKKEVHYFDGGLDPNVDNYVKGAGWYRSHFPLSTVANRDMRVLEASPLYLFNPDVPQRIFNLLPHARIIVLLRNPVDRAISHYQHEVNAMREHRPMMQAFVDEDVVTKSNWDNHELRSKSFTRHSYKARGLYVIQIKRYLQVFRREQIFIMKSESMFDDPDIAIQSLLSFMSIDNTYEIPDKRPINTRASKRAIASDVREYLSEFFEPYNERLLELLGDDICWP